MLLPNSESRPRALCANDRETVTPPKISVVNDEGENGVTDDEQHVVITSARGGRGEREGEAATIYGQEQATDLDGGRGLHRTRCAWRAFAP